MQFITVTNRDGNKMRIVASRIVAVESDWLRSSGSERTTASKIITDVGTYRIVEGADSIIKMLEALKT